MACVIGRWPGQLKRWPPTRIRSSLRISAMTDSKKTLMARLIFLGVLVLLIPWKTQIAPAWKVRVVDQSGNAIPGLAVSQNWTDPNFHGWWLEEDFRTDENGVVSFPERSVWRNSLLAGGSSIWNRVLFEKNNYDAMAFGWGDYSHGEVYYRRGQVLPETLVMHR